jgi:hypothetical protein
MYIKKRLGQTAALLLAGMAVGLAGGAFATDSEVPVDWNASPIENGAYRETFESALTWDRLVVTASTNSRVTVVPPSRANTWFGEATTKAMKIPDDASYTNTLKYGNNSSVSFATSPVFVDMRIQFTAYEGTPPDNAKLAVFVSTTNKIHVVHNDGVTTNTWPANNLLSAWHQLTVRLEKDGKCAVLLDDVTVTNNLTPKAVGTAGVLASLEFANSGYVDDLYVSHGNPQAYPGETDPVPVAAALFAGDDSVAAWLAGKLADTSLTAGATFTGFDQADMDAAYLLNKLDGTASAATAPTYTFGAVSVDVVSDTVVNVNCSLTVTGGTGTLTGRKIQLLGKGTIGGTWAAIPGQVVSAPTYSSGVITVPFTGIDSTSYKFFKAQIVEI